MKIISEVIFHQSTINLGDLKFTPSPSSNVFQFPDGLF